MGLISCDRYPLCTPDGHVSFPFGRYSIDTAKPRVPTFKGRGAPGAGLHVQALPRA